MTTPHEKDVEVIKALTNEEIADLKLWEATALAMPYGVATEVAENLGLSPRTVQSWRVDPDLISTKSLKANDPSGRRGVGYQFNKYLLALNGPFPPGAQFLLRYLALKLAKGQAVQGHEHMKAVLQLADEARAIEVDARAVEERARAFREKVAAIGEQR